MKKIVLIGAGKLATQLALALQQLDDPHKLYITNRNTKKAKDLAVLTSSEFIPKLSEIPVDADLYVIAVSDGAIEEVAEQLTSHVPQDAFVVHTSGATPATILQPHFERYGVFYPLQTFDLETSVDFSSIPLLLDAPIPADLERLEDLAKHLSKEVHQISNEQRAVLHVAAVFASNFANHQYHLAEQILFSKGLSFDLLKPLILETARKVQQKKPADAQTGPAIRGDQTTINRHLDYLEAYPDLARIYQLLTKSIQKDIPDPPN